MKPKYFLLLCISFLIFNSSLLIGTVRFVSKTGSSTPPYTSWETAADSIQKAINICVVGDTVIVANGVYYENLVINMQLSLIGTSMDSTVIDGTGLGDRSIRFFADGSIENFDLKGKGLIAITNVVSVIAKNLIVKNCRVSQASDGIITTGSFAEVKNCFITDTYSGIGGACSNGNCEQYFNNNLLYFNNSNARGISLGLGGTYYIDNNILLYNNEFEAASDGISCSWPKKVYIRNNLISGFLDNIFFDIVDDTAFVNNNVLMHTKDHGANSSISSSGNRLFVNNTVLSNNSKGIYQSGSGFIKSNYNLFWNNGTDIIGSNYGDSDRVADPMFINDTLPTPNGNYDFHLQAFSPGIDKGDPNIIDVDGSRSDIGLYGGPLGQSYTYQDLRPRAPVNFSAVVDTNKIQLQWNRNTEADTSRYNIYRDTVPNFIIDSTKLVTSITDTFFVEQIPGTSKIYVYKITCVDNQGNESEPSVERVINVTSISEYPMVIDDYLLYQNYPNPFNPSTTIGYKIINKAYVKIMVYDITGSLVSVLVNKEQAAGYYEVEFTTQVGSLQSAIGNDLASGIYLYRIEVIGEGRIPVYSDMKKMILLK